MNPREVRQRCLEYRLQPAGRGAQARPAKAGTLNAVILMFICFCLALPVGAQDDNQSLRWGGDSDGGAPYVFRDPQDLQRLIGFEVELADALGRTLKRPAVFVQNQWDALIPGLQRGNYDLVLNGLEITEDRRQRINFSLPYYVTVLQISVRKENTAISSLADLKGKRAGALKGSFAQRVLEREGGIKVVTHDNMANQYQDLANGRLDAALNDYPTAVYYSGADPKLKFTGEPIERVPYAIGLRKEDTALLQQVNDALLTLIKTGELQRIYNKWGLWNAETEKLFAELTAPQGQALEAYTQAVTRKLTWREWFARYTSYLTTLLVQGAPMTLLISTLGMALAIALGLLLALVNLYAPRPLAWAARAYVELFRGTPLLIQLYLIFYGLPNIGIKLSPLVAAVVGLGLNYAAYEAENYRAGIQAIPRGQMEAALSLGMTRAQSLRYVVVPQAMRLVIPPVTNDFIALFKDSSIVSVITMVELTKVYGQLASTYYDYIGVGLLTAAIYFLMGLPFVRLARWAERRLATDKRVVTTAKRRWLGVGAKPATG
jgi:polar amino acid transport system substrate-binding protein